MTTESKQRKNIDYTNSAENLCNPGEVMDLLVQLHAEEAIKVALEGQLKERCNELVDGITKSEEVIAQIQKKIKEAIDQFGSYQNIESGEYAVKYRRMSKSYHVEPFKLQYPKYVPAVVEETINIKALEGLVKGGLIKQDELLQPLMVDGLEKIRRTGKCKVCEPVVTETASFAYFIR